MMERNRQAPLPNGLHELRTMLGNAQFGGLTKRFSADLARRLEELRCSTLSAERASKASHQLVAVAGALGLGDLAAASARLGRCARGHPTTQELQAAILETVQLGSVALDELNRAIVND